MNEILVGYIDELAGGPGCVLEQARRIVGDEGLRIAPRWVLGGDAALLRLRRRWVIAVASDVIGPRRINLVAHELAELALRHFGMRGDLEARANAIASVLESRCADCRHVRSLGIASPGSRPSEVA
jgi:hypothetical protein